MTGIRAASAANVITVARREFAIRARTRTFALSTIFLVAMAVAVGLAPVVIGWLNRSSSAVAVYVGAADLRGDPVATLDALLNPPTPQAGPSDAETPAPNAFVVTRSTDLVADRQRVLDGTLTALLDVERDSAGATVFTVYTTQPDQSTVAVISRQAATAVAIADRLGHLGLDSAQQAGLFAPPAITVRSPDLSKPAASSQAMQQRLSNVAVVFALEMFLLLAIVLYGTWVAQSVVEEKSSRMMEIILAAASPFELLTGKVLGVSAVAFLQFAAVLVAAIAALFVQGQVASMVLGTAAPTIPSGLTPTILIVYSVFFVLGFLLYAVLFAAVGSLVSRQEDVQQIVLPMTLLAAVGYIVASYGSIGMIDPNGLLAVALSWVPFLAPYLMVSRLSEGTAGLLEVGAAAALLGVTFLATAWIASRIYAAGVMMYGQKPSVGMLWKAMREA